MKSREFLGISIASAIVSSLELRHNPKDEMFGRDKGFKCPNLRWTAPGFQFMKGIIHAPCAKPALRPESRDALLTAIAKARGWINDIRLGRIPARSGVARFWSRSGGEPAPSLDMAEVSQRSATGSRSSEGSILTRRDAPPDFLASAIIRAMDACARGGNCLTDRCESDRSIRAAKCRHACDQRAPHPNPARAPL